MTSRALLLLSSVAFACAPEAAAPGPDLGHEATKKPVVERTCFSGVTSSGRVVPLTMIVHSLVAIDDGTAVQVKIVFNREFVDNTYGEGSIGWDSRKDGHKFRELVGSDHTELVLRDLSGEVRFQAKIDYLSESSDAPSGFESLGVSGGDGRMIVGAASDVISWGSSIAENMNHLGYVLTESSPPTDASYTQSTTHPGWDYWVAYDLTVHGRAFEPEGFGAPEMASVHASPSKWAEGNTIEVEESECPPDGAGSPFPDCRGEGRCSPSEGDADPAGSAAPTGDPSGF
jgi:hypothetical protein